MTILSKEEINRYIQQIRLPEIGIAGQEKIKKSSVLVIGTGGLGCPVLQYLTAAGVGTIGIMDNDWVDESNLHRQILFNVNDLSKPKPLAAKEKLQLLNPNVEFKIHFSRLNKNNSLEILSQYDIIVDCTDNFPARYLISDSCVILNKPEVYGAIHKFSGQVMVLNYKSGPTLRCIYPQPPHPLEIPSCEESGVIGSVTGLIGTLQATEVFKIILDLGGILSGKLFLIDTLNFNTQLTSFARNPESSKITELGEYEDVSLYNAQSVREISADDLNKMLSINPGIRVIDLRDTEDNADIGYKTTVIPHFEINQMINLISDTDPVVFYCRSGSRTISVINYLQTIYKMDNLYSLMI